MESQHFQNETSLNLNEARTFGLIRRGYEELNQIKKRAHQQRSWKMQFKKEDFNNFYGFQANLAIEKNKQEEDKAILRSSK